MNTPGIPVPDPTVLTTQQLERGLQAERDYLEARLATLVQRLDSMDLANEVLNETVTRVPTDMQREVGHMRELLQASIEGIERRLADNDLRFDHALRAQKELTTQRNKSNTTAIDKSESSIERSMEKLSELFRSGINGISSQVADLKGRVTAIEASKTGATETRSSFYALVGVGISMVLLTIALVSFVISTRPAG